MQGGWSAYPSSATVLSRYGRRTLQMRRVRAYLVIASGVALRERSAMRSATVAEAVDHCFGRIEDSDGHGIDNVSVNAFREGAFTES